LVSDSPWLHCTTRERLTDGTDEPGRTATVRATRPRHPCAPGTLPPPNRYSIEHLVSSLSSTIRLPSSICFLAPRLFAVHFSTTPGRLEGLLRKQQWTLTSPVRLGELRGLEVLERIGTAEARQILETLAGGAPEALLTQEARASLERLARRPATSERPGKEAQRSLRNYRVAGPP
jgi:hypothetical protein